MSIRTSSGSCRGSTRSASSAVAQAHTHRKSGERLTMVSRPSRVVLLSSTIATFVINSSCAISDRQPKLNLRSGAGLAADLAMTTKFLHSLLHADQSIVPGQAINHGKAFPIIGNSDFQ